jgi:hypothetical protein
MVAPFFHITAWLGVIAVGVILLVKAVLGRRLFVLIVPVMTVGLLAFLTQLVQVSDCYHLLPYLQPLATHPTWVIIAGFVAVLTLAFLCSRLAMPAGPAQPLADRNPRRFALVLWLLLLVLGAYLWLPRGEGSAPPVFPLTSTNYLSPTNLHGLAVWISPLVLLAALAGWGAWLFRAGAHADLRLGLAGALLPGLLLSGWTGDFREEARCWLTYVAPVIALCLTALVMWLWTWRGTLGRVAAVAVGLLLLGSLWRGCTQLMTHVEHAGLYRVLEQLAAPVQEAKGWLLAEYSPAAAVMEHLFAIPTLGLDNAYHANTYPEAEQAWERLMARNPRQAVFFLTPFQMPHSERFVFKLERRLQGQGRALVRELGQVPQRIQHAALTLSLYRMALRTPKAVADEPPLFPQSLLPDASNLGLRGFAHVAEENWLARGLALPAKTGVHIPLDGDAPLLRGNGLFFIFNGPFIPGRPPRVDGKFEGVQDAKWIHLADDWWVLRLRGALHFEREFHIHSTADALLADVLLLRAGVIQSLATNWPAEEVSSRPLRPLRARWALPQASFALNVPASGAGELFLYLSAPAAVGRAMPLQVAGRGVTNTLPVQVRTDIPRWYIFRSSDIGLTASNPVVTLHTGQPWHCDRRGLPPELGVLLGYAVVTE